MNQTAVAAGVNPNQDLITLIGRLINIFLSLLGVVFLVLMLYAGWMWMSSNGDAEKIKKAQVTIRNAVIGLLIIGAAWAIVAFVIGWLTGEYGGVGGFIPAPQQPVGLPRRAGSLGRGIIESHIPERNATDVPRNTPIIITFKEAIKPDSFIKDWSTNNANTGLNDDLIKVYRVKDGLTSALTSDKARVNFTDDKKTFVIRPVEYLGSPNVNVMYAVDLAGGAKGILKADGKPAFSGSFGDGYTWQFEVSTKLDLAPPFITAVIPTEGGKYARNIIVQINFNKAIDPTSASGRTASGFQNIQVLSGPVGSPATTPVPGEFRMSNKYTTVEFVPEFACGTNSCGRTIYCLPGPAAIEVDAKAAHLSASAPPPQADLTQNGYDGVVSVVGNSLDGNKNGAGEGPPNDDFSFRFATTNDVKLAPPTITDTLPSSDPSTGGNSNIPFDKPVLATFDSLLQSSTVNTSNAQIEAYGFKETDPDTFWWSTGVQWLRDDGQPIDPTAVPPDIASKAAVVINHRQFLKSDPFPDLNYYDPSIFSGVQDAYQNCFNPAAKCGTGVGSPSCCNSSPTDEACRKAFCRNTPNTQRCKDILAAP